MNIQTRFKNSGLEDNLSDLEYMVKQQKEQLKNRSEQIFQRWFKSQERANRQN